MDTKQFEKELLEAILNELLIWRRRLMFDEIRALNIVFDPGNGVLELSLLTDKEEFDEKESELGKWDVGAWRLYNITETYNDPWPQTKHLREWMQDFDEKNTNATKKIHDSIVKTLKDKKLFSYLKKNYNLSKSFESSVIESVNMKLIKVNYKS